MLRGLRTFGAACAVMGVALSLAVPAEAVPITGGIRFSGAVAPTDFTTTNSIDIVANTASLMCFAVPGADCTGDYAALNGAGGVAVYNDFTFNPPSGTIAPLWIFTRGDVTYSFDLTNVTAFNRSTAPAICPSGSPPGATCTADGITIFGFGTARITGFEPTAANWSFSADNTGVFAFSSTTSATGGGQSVPEPVSMLLLGIGVFGLAAAARRTRARS